MSAISTNLEESETAVIVETKDNPLPIGRVGTYEGADVPTLVVRYKTQVCSVWVNDRDVCRYSGFKNVSILREHQVLAVRCPVLLNRYVETVRSDLEHVTPIDI